MGIGTIVILGIFGYIGYELYTKNKEQINSFIKKTKNNKTTLEKIERELEINHQQILLLKKEKETIKRNKQLKEKLKEQNNIINKLNKDIERELNKNEKM